MKRSTIVAAIVLALFSAFIIIATPIVGDRASMIDKVRWEGYPMAPCFVNASECGGHILGSDENGRDMVARLIVGGGVTLGTAALALFIELAIAFGLMLLARHGGPILDRIVIAFAEGMSALPRVPLALLIAIVTFATARHYIHPSTLQIATWFGVIFWPAAFFAMRSRAAPIRFARRSVGDLMTILLVSSTIEFFGYGHQPPTPTWGNMLANMDSVSEIAWWASVFPAVCIVVTVLLLDIVRRGLPPVQDAAWFDKLAMTSLRGSP